MAYIVQAVQSYTDTVFAASFTPDQWITEEQKNDDRILFCAVNDGGGSAISISSGWTEIYRSSASVAGVRLGIWEAKRSGSDITAPTISGASDDWNCCAMLIRDADPTTFLDVAIGTTEQTVFVTKYTAPSITTTNNNSLIIRVAALDANGVSSPALTIGGFTDVSRRIENAAVELYLAEQMKRTAGSVGTFTWDRGLSRGGVLATLAIRNKSGGAVSPHSDQVFNVVEEFTLDADSPTVASIHTRQATICGVSTLTPTSGPNVANAQSYSTDPNWYSPYIQVTTQPPATVGVYGGIFPVTADWSSGKLFALLASTAQNNVMSKDGPIFYFEDNSGNWRTWRPINRFYFGSVNFKAIIADLPNETFVDSVGSIDWANIVYFGMVHQNTTANGTSRTVQLRALGSIDTLKVAGGGSSRPVTFNDVAKIIVSGSGIYRGFIQGSGQALVGIPLQIGNGTDSTYFIGAAQSLEYQIGGTVSFPWFRLGELDQPLTIYASSADTINLDSTIVATTTRQPFTINSSSSTSASYSFNGASIVGWNVTWKTGVDCSGATFSRCGKIDAKGASFSNCFIKESAATDAAIRMENGGSVLQTSFTKGAETYAIEISGTGTVSLEGSTFSGYTKPLNILATTGTVTIERAAGDSEITFDTAGATVVLSQPQNTFTVSNIVSGSRLLIRNTDNQNVLVNETVAGTSRVYSYTYTADIPIEIVLRKASSSPVYQEFRTIATLTSNNGSVVANQVLDE
jgi:hypothetical protein